MPIIDRPFGAVQQMELLENVRIAKLLQAIDKHSAGSVTEAVEWTRQGQQQHRDVLNASRWRLLGSIGRTVRELTGCDPEIARVAEQAALGETRNAITIRGLTAYCKAHQIPVPGVCR